MASDFEERIEECIPQESEFLGVSGAWGLLGMIELNDGSLLRVSRDGRATSSDGGRTWTDPEPLRHVDGNSREFCMYHLQRLNSGAIGGFVLPCDDPKATPYGFQVSFARSTDEGKTWSKPFRVSEPYNNVVVFDATTTSSGRIVAVAYTLVGKTHREKGRALFGDETAQVGAHGYEHFFTYCWAYYSDDEGQTWHSNEGKGKWGAGGELFVTLDYSAGGHWRCNEPVVAEVSPDHMLMLLRTPLGRLFQTWSADNGSTWSQPEPSPLASALAPAALKRIPGSDDLLVIWNQSTPEEIQRGLQRHRLSTVISKDGGVTWLRGQNLFSVYGADDRRYVEPPPIGNYRAMELAPRLPTNDIQGTYPFVTFWKDRAIVRFVSAQRSLHVVGKPEEVGHDLPELQRRGKIGDVYISLPISWFYEDLRRFG